MSADCNTVFRILLLNDPTQVRKILNNASRGRMPMNGTGQVALGGFLNKKRHLDGAKGDE